MSNNMLAQFIISLQVPPTCLLCWRGSFQLRHCIVLAMGCLTLQYFHHVNGCASSVHNLLAAYIITTVSACCNLFQVVSAFLLVQLLQGVYWADIIAEVVTMSLSWGRLAPATCAYKESENVVLLEASS